MANDSKCNALESATQAYADDQKAREINDRIASDSIANPYIDDTYEAYERGIQNRVRSISGKIKTIADIGKYKFDQAKLDQIAKKAFGDNSVKIEKAKLITHLKSAARHDPDFHDSLNELTLEQSAKVDYIGLRQAGQQVDIDPLTNLPNLYQLPVSVVRNIYRKAAPLMDFDDNGKAHGLIDSNLAFEFRLPKFVLASAGKSTVNKFKRNLAKFPNTINRRKSSFTGPIDIPFNQEKQLVHQGTNIPIHRGLLRSQAGLRKIYDSINSMTGGILKREGMIESNRQLWELVTDIQFGKAVFRVDKEGYGQVYKFAGSKVPVTNKNGRFKTYENGDIVYRWKGINYDNTRLSEIQEKNPKFSHTTFLRPYQFTSDDGRPLKPLNLNQPQVGELGQDHLQAFDSALQHLDVILSEVGDEMIEVHTREKKRFKKSIDLMKSKGIKIEKSVFGELAILIENAANDAQDVITFQETKKKGNIQERDRYALEDGTEILGTSYDKYFPTKFFNADLGENIILALEKIEDDLTLLNYAVEPSDNPTEESEKLRDIAIERQARLLRAKKHLLEAKEAFINGEGSLYKDDDVPDIFRPFEKHFKTPTNFIPYEARRKDKNLVEDYISSVVRNMVKIELMNDALEAYIDVDSPTYRNYILNQFRKAFGSLQAEGSALGFRFSVQDLSDAMGFADGGESIRKVVNGMRSYQTFSTLGGWLSGMNNMSALVNKAMEVGIDQFVEALQDMQLAENQKLLVKSGIFSFEDMIENHMIQYGNPEEQRRYKQLVKKYKADIKAGNDVAFNKALLKMLKTTNKPWARVTREMANWAISGEFQINEDDSPLMKGTKTVLNLRRFVSMSLTERIVRGTSFMIGVNQAIASGAAKDKNDPVAQEWGLKFVQNLDFSLGPEGVGDNFGNDIMQYFMQVRVWGVQKSSYDLHSLKDYMMANYSLDEDISKASRSVQASYDFIKALSITAFGSGLKVGGPLYGLLAGFQLGGGSLITSAVGGTAAYLGVKGMHAVTGIKERQKGLRLTNPESAKGSQMLLFHGFFSAFYGALIFAGNLNFGHVGVAGAIASKILENTAFKSGFNRVGPSFTSPLYSTAVAAILLLFKAMDDEQEVDTYDFAKLLGSYAGVGMMQIFYALVDLFHDENDIVRRKNMFFKEGSLSLNLNFPNVVPWFNGSDVKEAYDRTKATRKIFK